MAIRNSKIRAERNKVIKENIENNIIPIDNTDNAIINDIINQSRFEFENKGTSISIFIIVNDVRKIGTRDIEAALEE